MSQLSKPLFNIVPNNRLYFPISKVRGNVKTKSTFVLFLRYEASNSEDNTQKTLGRTPVASLKAKHLVSDCALAELTAMPLVLLYVMGSLM